MAGPRLRRAVRVAIRTAAALAVVYGLLTAGLAWTMRQPPR